LDRAHHEAGAVCGREQIAVPVRRQAGQRFSESRRKRRMQEGVGFVYEHHPEIDRENRGDQPRKGTDTIAEVRNRCCSGVKRTGTPIPGLFLGVIDGGTTRQPKPQLPGMGRVYYQVATERTVNDFPQSNPPRIILKEGMEVVLRGTEEIAGGTRLD